MRGLSVSRFAIDPRFGLQVRGTGRPLIATPFFLGTSRRACPRGFVLVGRRWMLETAGHEVRYTTVHEYVWTLGNVRISVIIKDFINELLLLMYWFYGVHRNT